VTPDFKKPKAVKGRVAQSVPPYTVSPASATSTATVTLKPLVKVPRSFMGLSINTNEVPDYTDEPAQFENFIRLLTPSDDGPFVLRLGGTEADESYWETDESSVDPQFQASAANTIVLNQAWVDSVATVVKATSSKVMLNINAAAHDPQMADAYIGAAEATLPSGSLLYAGVGNEPDLYATRFGPFSGVPVLSWTSGFGAGQYAGLFSQYSRSLTQRFPGLRMAGPEVSAPMPGWTSALLDQDPGQTGLVTTHIYPWNACSSVSSIHYPVTGYYLLSSYPQQTAAEVGPSVALAHAHGLPFRLTELGSATCGGVAAVNNTFAPALWSINQLFDFMQVGVNGLNVHIRADLPNTALQSLDGVLTPSPFFYGLATAVKALDGGGEVEQVTGKFPANVTVWAVRGSQGWHLLYVNSNATEQTVTTKVAATGKLTESLLTAPSPASTSATLAGQTISSDGTWQGTLQQTRVARRHGAYAVRIPPNSAVLGTVGL
jgi:hypothetical protein